MDNGSEGPLIKLFNVACHEAKSEFKQLIFFEQIQRFQLEKKYKKEDEKYLKDKEKFLQQYFNNMKSEHKASQSQKTLVLNELNSYIRNLVKEEISKNKNKGTLGNYIKVESETHENELNTSNRDNLDNFNYNEILNSITELKNNQQEIINNVAALFNLKDEIYLDFGRIKNVLVKFQSQFRELEGKIKDCQNENSLKSKAILSENQININSEISQPLNNGSNENLENVNETFQSVNKRLQMIESSDLLNKIEIIKTDIKSIKSKNEKNFNTLKACDKQIEEKLYEKIRQRQKEIFDGFTNQDKKIINLDENYKRKFRELDERCMKCNEQCASLNKRINELTEKVTKIKFKDSSEEIKKLSEEVRENKKKEDDRITNITNILNEKINKIDTQSEFMNNEVTEIRKGYQKFESDIKTIQDKHSEIEHSMESFGNLAVDVNDKYEKLLSKNESIAMNMSIIESSVNSMTNNLKNYDLEKMKNSINVIKTDVNNLLQDHFPKYKKIIETKFNDADIKLMTKIGEVYKSINSYSQKVDDKLVKFNDKYNNFVSSQNKYWDTFNKRISDFTKKVNEKNKSIREEIESIKKDSNTSSSTVNDNDNYPNVNNYVDNEIEKLKDYMNKEINSIKSTNETSSTVKEVSTSLNRYIDGEITKLKKIILTSTAIPMSKNDPNYITLQTFLTEILSNHWLNFEKNWKMEFYKCIEKINSALNKEKQLVLSPIVINIP